MISCRMTEAAFPCGASVLWHVVGSVVRWAAPPQGRSTSLLVITAKDQMFSFNSPIGSNLPQFWSQPHLESNPHLAPLWVVLSGDLVNSNFCTVFPHVLPLQNSTFLIAKREIVNPFDSGEHCNSLKMGNLIEKLISAADSLWSLFNSIFPSLHFFFKIKIK